MSKKNSQDLISDDTDSEEVLARVGRIPFHWYDQFKHFGYDVNA